MTDDAIPAGMVAWHGGDAAPADWDGGPVLLRRFDWLNAEGGLRWCHFGTSGDIIAYTPTPSIVTGSDERAREVARQALRRWHRDSCYPDAMPFELDIGLDAIIAALAASRPTEAGAATLEMKQAALDASRQSDPPFLPVNRELWAAEMTWNAMIAERTAAVATQKPPVDQMREALEQIACFKPKAHPEGRWSEGVSEWNRAGNYVAGIARKALARNLTGDGAGA